MKRNFLTLALTVSAFSLITTSCNLEEHKEKREERREEREERREERREHHDELKNNEKALKDAKANRVDPTNTQKPAGY